MAPCHERWLHAYDARAYMARPVAPRTKGLLHRDRSIARDRPAAGQLLSTAALRQQVLQSEHPICRICTLHACRRT